MESPRRDGRTRGRRVVPKDRSRSEENRERPGVFGRGTTRLGRRGEGPVDGKELWVESGVGDSFEGTE